MGQLIKGLNLGVHIFTPYGWFRNGTEPGDKVKKHLMDDGYKFVPHNASPAEEEKLENAGPLPTVPAPVGKNDPLPIINQNAKS
jgi:hypothetical protein